MSTLATKPMTSKEAKGLLKDILGQHPRVAGVIEEVVNTFNADIISVKWDGEVSEYEIKVSKQDLRGEIRALCHSLLPNAVQKQEYFFGSRTVVDEDVKLSHTKITKHHNYLVDWRDTYGGVKSFRPHKFYFAVPDYLVSTAKELLKDVPNYGVLNISTGKIEKPARKLHSEPMTHKTMLDLFFRACTEGYKFRYEARETKKLVSDGHRIPVHKKLASGVKYRIDTNRYEEYLHA